MTATLTKWYEEYGRHEIVAGGKKVSLNQVQHSLVLNKADVERSRQHDLDDKGIAKTAREEKKRARDQKLNAAENERMAKLYREHVLGEKPQPNFVSLGEIKPAAKDSKEEVGTFGD